MNRDLNEVREREGASHAANLKAELPGRGNNMCKATEVRVAEWAGEW